MSRRHITAFALVLTSTAALAPAATAGPVGEPVSAVVHTTFDDQPDEFTSTVEGCPAGTVVDERPMAHYTPWGGTFSGLKVFTCESGSGWALRLNARFGMDGSTGSWVVAYGWGDYAGARGSGSLVGIPAEAGITDVYTGVVR